VIIDSEVINARLGNCALRLRALASLLLALVRRRIVCPKAQDYAIMADYIRDLRPMKWGSMINLRCKNLAVH
jgi:hypothetical protein